MQRGFRVGRSDLAGAPAGKQRKHDGDQSAHDVGVGIALESRRDRCRPDAGVQPDLADAALHLVRGVARLFGKGASASPSSMI